MYKDIKEQSNKVKANYFYSKQLKVHIKIKPTGAFDAKFESDIIDNIFYWIKKVGQNHKEMLFLIDIFDIKPFEEVIE